MKDLKKQIPKLKKDALASLKKARSLDALEQVRIAYLGRSGKIAEIMGQLKTLSLEQKRTCGPLLNALKQEVQQAYEQQLAQVGKARTKKAFDVTAYEPNQQYGSLHLLTQILDELSTMFASMGYAILDGPEVETDYYNFSTLNIPLDHPARDSHDTFWLTIPDLLLRTHTSTIQAHAMEKKGAPVAIFSRGRVYRNEATDATHDFMFNQGEGLLVGKNVSMANLLATAQTFLQRFFNRDDLQIRVRPGYFPFVEPGVEIDGSCPFCKKGCSICKHTKWIELLGAGLVHPNVLRKSGIDPEQYSGFAFGFGIERLAMIKYGITDIRLFHSTQLSFLKQFASS
jgi:phenylalanyl-tRNA synthetase alpha chain